MDPTILASRSAFLDKSIVNDVPWSKLELCFPFNGEVHPFIITSGFFYIYAGMTIQYYIILYHISHEPPQQYFQIPKNPPTMKPMRRPTHSSSSTCCQSCRWGFRHGLNVYGKCEKWWNPQVEICLNRGKPPNLMVYHHIPYHLMAISRVCSLLRMTSVNQGWFPWKFHGCLDLLNDYQRISMYYNVSYIVLYNNT